MNRQPAHSSRFAIVLLMALGFGLVGIDRFLIVTMYPVISRELHLSYGDIGTITGSLAIAWGLAALVMGNVADRIGRSRVLVGSLILFSLLIGASGLATGLAGLVLVRVLMGIADGAFAPASIAATLEASPAGKVGRNIGIQQMTLTLFGLGLSPLLVAGLLHVINWRLIFSIFVIPGLFLAWLTWRVIPQGLVRAESQTAARQSTFADWRAVLAVKNVRLLMVGMLCWLICLITTSAFLPSYLMDHLGLDFGAMGVVMSSIGFGAAAGTLTLPWLSDRIGRKPVMLASIIGAALSLVMLASLGGETLPLFAALFMVNFFNNALITLTVGPICAESVPPHLMGTASGVVIAAAELGGGGLGPIVAGMVAERFGIEHLLRLPIGAMVIGFGVCALLDKTDPLGIRQVVFH